MRKNFYIFKQKKREPKKTLFSKVFGDKLHSTFNDFNKTVNFQRSTANQSTIDI